MPSLANRLGTRPGSVSFSDLRTPLPSQRGPWSRRPSRRNARRGLLEPIYLIFVSLNSTCLRATGSYFLKTSFSVAVRGFFFVT